MPYHLELEAEDANSLRRLLSQLERDSIREGTPACYEMALFCQRILRQLKKLGKEGV